MKSSGCALSALLLVLWLPACGDNSDESGDGDGASDGGSSSDGDVSHGDGDSSASSGGGTVDGGSGGGTSSGGTGSDGGLPTETSSPMSVQIVRVSFRSTDQSLRATAASQTTIENPELLEGLDFGDTGSRTLEAGDCKVSYFEDVGYVEPEIPAGLMVEQTTRNAGRLTASFRVDEGVLSAELAPEASLRYPTGASFTPTNLFLENGTPGTLTAEGNHIPGFTVELQFPLALVATNPVASSTDGVPVSTIEVSKSADFTVTWDRGAPGVAYNIQLASDSPGSSDQRLNCSFDSTAGQGTIAASLLAHLDVGKILDATTVSEIDVTAGQDVVKVRMIRETVTPDRMSGIKLVIVP